MKRIFIIIFIFLLVGCSNSVKKTNVDVVNDKVLDNEVETGEVPVQEVVKRVIVLDPGHQRYGDSSLEPIGPGADLTKAKVTTGAEGVVTGQKESELNLKVSLLLRDELLNMGYKVVMTREVNDVNISNKERAEIANREDAVAFIRIHANSVDDSSVRGVLTMCQTKDNIYNGYLSDKSCDLSLKILEGIISSTGFRNMGVTKTDIMSGINWSKVPVTIVEMGFLSNSEEDRLLATEEYQVRVAHGIALGVDSFVNG